MRGVLSSPPSAGTTLVAAEIATLGPAHIYTRRRISCSAGWTAVNIAVLRPYWRYAVAAALLGIQIAVLHSFGQPWVSATGRLLLWVNDPFSPDMSQQLADWYSFSHLIHGFIFFAVLQLASPRAPLGTRLLIAMGVEIAWEIAENTPAVIQHYRQQALAAGYTGDSILNSLSDTAMMSTGFFVASRLSARYVIALALGLELFTAVMIRDNLTLNVINLIAPNNWSPIVAIHQWQAGAKH
jgi:hypothetical protein